MCTYPAAAAAAAAGPDDQYYDRVLLPISPVPQLVPGAFGSQWAVICTGRNESDVPVVIVAFTPPIPGASVGFEDKRGPHSTFDINTPTLDPNVGAFVFVSKGALPSVAFSLRVRDTSRLSETWGTTIPVVREQQTFVGPATINDVPAEPGFRNLLRVYDFDTPSDRIVRVAVYDDGAGTTPISVSTLTLSGPAFPPTEVPHDEIPGHAMMDISGLNVGGSGKLRIVVTPLSPGLRFWAFVASTHNTTQFITLELPD